MTQTGKPFAQIVVGYQAARTSAAFLRTNPAPNTSKIRKLPNSVLVADSYPVIFECCDRSEDACANINGRKRKT